MYHIANDKRAKKSATLISQGMLELLNTHPLESISISALNKKTGVSRATFYRAFDRVEDVLEYLCDELFDEVQFKMTHHTYESPQLLVIEFIRAWMDKEILIKSLSQNGMLNLLCKAHLKKLSLVKEMIFPEPAETEISDTEMDYVCYFLAYTMPMVLDVWVLHGQRESAEELYANLVKVYQLAGNLLNPPADGTYLM